MTERNENSVGHGKVGNAKAANLPCPHAAQERHASGENSLARPADNAAPGTDPAPAPDRTLHRGLRRSSLQARDRSRRRPPFGHRHARRRPHPNAGGTRLARHPLLEQRCDGQSGRSAPGHCGRNGATPLLTPALSSPQGRRGGVEEDPRPLNHVPPPPFRGEGVRGRWGSSNQAPGNRRGVYRDQDRAAQRPGARDRAPRRHRRGACHRWEPGRRPGRRDRAAREARSQANGVRARRLRERKRVRAPAVEGNERAHPSSPRPSPPPRGGEGE